MGIMIDFAVQMIRNHVRGGILGLAVFGRWPRSAGILRAQDTFTVNISEKEK